jgi:hypothetical protein
MRIFLSFIVALTAGTLVFFAVATSPVYFGCITGHGNWWKLSGRIHCTAEAWRSLR